MTPSTSIARSPGDVGVAGGAGSEQRSSRPCRAHHVLGRRGGGAREHLAHGRVLRGDLLALVVAEREHVQQQRLLDLGARRRGRRGSRARSAGGRAARSPRRARASSASVASTGKVLTCRTRHRGRRVGRAQRRGEAAARAHAQDEVRGEQGDAQRPGAVEALGAPRSCCARRSHHAPAARRRGVGRHPHAPCTAGSKGSTCGPAASSSSVRPGGSRRRGAPGGARRRLEEAHRRRSSDRVAAGSSDAAASAARSNVCGPPAA